MCSHFSRIGLMLVSIGMMSAVHWVAAAETEPAAKGPLILNGGFEEGAGSFTGVGLHWRPNDEKSHPRLHELDTTIKHSGKASQLIRHSRNWNEGTIWQLSPVGSVTPGKKYLVEAWIRTAGVKDKNGWYVLGVAGLAGERYIGDVKMMQPEELNYDWRKVSIVAKAVPPVDRLAVLLTRYTDGDVWYDDITVTELPEGPWLLANVDTLTQRIPFGHPASVQSFLVRNGGDGEAPFTVSVDGDWVRAVPADGVATDRELPIHLVYDATKVHPGVNEARVTVHSDAASNKQVVVGVRLVALAGSDFDKDADVDVEDFTFFQRCYGQAQDQPVEDACKPADLNNDLKIDTADLTIMLRSVQQSASSQPAAK